MSNDVLITYGSLDPDTILHAVESTGRICSGHVLALNSYENRVYQIGIEDAQPVIVKFYRPQRWTREQILEEHQFTLDLAEAEIPVIAPLPDENGETLYQFKDFLFAIYPRVGGRPPELDNPEQLLQLGRYIGRIHMIGSGSTFNYRPKLDIQTFGIAPREFLLANDFIPGDLVRAYETLTRDLLDGVGRCYSRAGKIETRRLHGDFHHGNILWRDDVPWIMDFDDTCNGPTIQDLWMLLSGDRLYMTARLADVLDGYTEFQDFNPSELHLVEALRTLRIMNYAAWIARRWQDPAFPLAFPHFGTQRYWEEHILALREQAALVDEEPLAWYQ